MSIEHDSGPVGGGAPRCNRGREADVIWARGAADGTGGGKAICSPLPPSPCPCASAQLPGRWRSLFCTDVHMAPARCKRLDQKKTHPRPPTPSTYLGSYPL